MASCFDPRPRVGATVPIYAQGITLGVSIHAPVWGRPHRRHRECGQGRVSIHAPVWGRQMGDPNSRANLLFRSTPPCGGDRRFHVGGYPRQRFDPRPRVGATGHACDGFRTHPVSIHAPVWGRPTSARRTFARSKFRSTPPCGGDLAIWSARIAPGCFDPRPRVGATIGIMCRCLGLMRFDPRPRVGATVPFCAAHCRHSVSIHAPVWGRRAGQQLGLFHVEVSIHAPVWGRPGRRQLVGRR